MKLGAIFPTTEIGSDPAAVRDWAQAEDALQEAYLVVMNKWQDFRPGTSVYSWTRRIVHYKAMEIIKKRKREVLVDDEEKLLAAVSDTILEQLDDRSELGDRIGELRRRHL